MSRSKRPCGRLVATLLLAVVALAVIGTPEASWAQRDDGFGYGAVGGISINAEGILSNAAVDALGQLQQARSAALAEIPEDLSRPGIRKVSLKGLELAVRNHLDRGEALPDEVQYLAGLTQIQYVFVYPEARDIVLVGPGEPWRVGPQGFLVGTQSGRPIMLLDDLVIALRTARDAAQGGISVSIDPTEEGLQRLRQFVGGLGPGASANMQPVMAGIEQNLGMQRISVNNVPPTSHFARVLVAADYRMKRIGMGFDPAPVRGLPSYLSMISGGRGVSNMLPRWWLEPRYEPILRDGEGLAFELRGAAVKAMAEEDFLSANGNREHTGKASPLAQRWADTMTQKYAELAVADPIFGQLQNCMEVAIVAALINKEDLTGKAGATLPTLTDPNQFEAASFPAPRAVPSQASVMKKGRNWVITASGGVLLPTWQIASTMETGDAPATARTEMKPTGQNWYK